MTGPVVQEGERLAEALLTNHQREQSKICAPDLKNKLLAKGGKTQAQSDEVTKMVSRPPHLPRSSIPTSPVKRLSPVKEASLKSMLEKKSLTVTTAKSTPNAGSPLASPSHLSSPTLPPSATLSQPLSPSPCRTSWMSGRSKWPFCPGLKGGGGPDSVKPSSRRAPSTTGMKRSCHSPSTSFQEAPTQKQPRLERDDQDLAREVELSDLEETATVEDQDPFRIFKGESAQDYFQRILDNSPKAQIYLEYLLFEKALPNLQSCQLDRIRERVRLELNIDAIEEGIKLMDLRFTPTPPDHHPVLDALAMKLGHSLNFIGPPTSQCLLCGARLVNRHADRRPTQVNYFTVTGPRLASKLVLTCR